MLSNKKSQTAFSLSEHSESEVCQRSKQNLLFVEIVLGAFGFRKEEEEEEARPGDSFKLSYLGEFKFLHVCHCLHCALLTLLEPRRELIASLATALLALPGHVRGAFAGGFGSPLRCFDCVCGLLTFCSYSGKPEKSLNACLR